VPVKMLGSNWNSAGESVPHRSRSDLPLDAVARGTFIKLVKSGGAFNSNRALISINQKLS